ASRNRPQVLRRARQCASSKQVLPGAAIVFDWPMENGTTCPILRWSIQELTSLVTLWSGYSQRRLTFDASFPGPGAEDKAVRQCPETARLAYKIQEKGPPSASRSSSACRKAGTRAPD